MEGGGGPCHLNVDFIYIHFGIMTIPALDQYLAIGKSYLLLTVHGKRKKRKVADGTRL